MLNNRKIRLMTKLAAYEKEEGKEDIRLSKYYKTDYVRLQVLKSITATTFGYLLLLLMIFLYKSEYLIENAVGLNYRSIGMTILGYFIVVQTISIIGTLIGYSIKYDRSRKKLSKYFNLLKRLRIMYKEEDGGLMNESQREDTSL